MFWREVVLRHVLSVFVRVELQWRHRFFSGLSGSGVWAASSSCSSRITPSGFIQSLTAKESEAKAVSRR
ncbi:MAG: hypothetical protein COB94_008250 [Gammaproteobacteria bacterium]|nr:hypothetical protein [Gammaproteobacteria bacterium]